MEEAAVLHVLMLPWLAHGHLSPFLELAKRLSHNNILVHLCSTPANLSSIKREFNEAAFPYIKLVPLHLPTTTLQPHLHTTKHLPSHLMPALKTSFDLSEPAFSQILMDLHPDLLFYDFIQPWAARAANRLNIPAVLYLTTGATATAFFYHYLQVKNKSASDAFPFPHISEAEHDIDCNGMYTRTANGITDADRLLECIALSSNFVAIKTFREIESKYMDYLSSLMGKELVPVGPLVPDTKDEDHESSRRLIQWLSSKERSSVLFVSFGSEYFMQEEEMVEIAGGLEQSKVSFLWVVRFPEQGEEEETRLQEAKEAPYSFLERVGTGTGTASTDDGGGLGAGLIVQGWAPQREILCHPSIGGFLTHCGWSSVMEGMRFGVPIVAMPMQLDQPLNAKLVAELGVGVEVKGQFRKTNNSDTNAEHGVSSTSEIQPQRRRVFGRYEIAAGIRQVSATDDQGLKITKRAKEMAEMLGFKGNQEISFLVGKMALLCTGGKERAVRDLSLLS